MTVAESKKILISFARSFLALDLARQLHSSGHIVYTADSMRFQVSRFSKSVHKNFKVSSPRFNPESYIQELIQIVKQEKIDLLIPIYEEITFLAKAKEHFPSFCKVFCPSFETYHELHNKSLFQNMLEQLGISHPKTYLIRDFQDLKKIKFESPFALKPCYSRASQKVRKAYPNEQIQNLTIEAHNPWVAQEWIEGDRYCTYSICEEGRMQAHAAYPVSYALDGNSCLIFEAIENKKIFDWIANFIKKINYTGQIAFDFIESNQILYPIECNPRATSGLLLFQNKDQLHKAFFKKTSEAIFPKVGFKKQIATGMLLYGWKKIARPNNRLTQFFKDLFSTKDVVFKFNDMKPFLLEPLIFAGIWKNSRRYKVPIPSSFTHDHDWNGESFNFQELSR